MKAPHFSETPIASDFETPPQRLLKGTETSREQDWGRKPPNSLVFLLPAVCAQAAWQSPVNKLAHSRSLVNKLAHSR